MYLEKWSPVVRKAEMAGNALAISVTFRCPFCSAKSDFETTGHIIDVALRVLLLDWKFREIIKPKSCCVCGVVSTLPEVEKTKIVKDMKQIITEAWLSNSLKESRVEI